MNPSRKDGDHQVNHLEVAEDEGTGKFCDFSHPGKSAVEVLMDAWRIENDGRDTIIDLRFDASGDRAKVMRLSGEPDGDGNIVPESTLCLDLSHPDRERCAGLICEVLGVQMGRLFQVDLRLMNHPYCRAIVRSHVLDAEAAKLHETLMQFSVRPSSRQWRLPDI